MPRHTDSIDPKTVQSMSMEVSITDHSGQTVTYKFPFLKPKPTSKLIFSSKEAEYDEDADFLLSTTMKIALPTSAPEISLALTDFILLGQVPVIEESLTELQKLSSKLAKPKASEKKSVKAMFSGTCASCAQPITPNEDLIVAVAQKSKKNAHGWRHEHCEDLSG